MLKINNAKGETVLKLHDNGEEEFVDKKAEEEYKKAGKKINEKKEGK